MTSNELKELVGTIDGNMSLVTMRGVFVRDGISIPFEMTNKVSGANGTYMTFKISQSNIERRLPAALKNSWKKAHKGEPFPFGGNYKGDSSPFEMKCIRDFEMRIEA